MRRRHFYLGDFDFSDCGFVYFHIALGIPEPIYSYLSELFHQGGSNRLPLTNGYIPKQ